MRCKELSYTNECYAKSLKFLLNNERIILIFIDNDIAIRDLFILNKGILKLGMLICKISFTNNEKTDCGLSV